jgi:C-terminal processing protease CtpA/Prc
MTIDYSRQRIILKRNRYFDEPVEVDMSGIDLMAEPDDFKTLVVNEVAAGSPAAVADVKEEDQLLEVDGRPVSEIGLDQVRQWFKQNGKEHLLTIKRGEQVLHVKIKLSRSI